MNYIKNIFYKKTIIFILLFTLLTHNLIYATNIAISNFFAPNIDASLMNTYLAEDESGNYSIQQEINNFQQKYIKSYMSDFEKEIQIIKYLVETVSFDETEVRNYNPHINESYKAYGALVNKKAVCSGYAKAFDLLAKSCGLLTNIVTGTAINSQNLDGPHAWNQICLDGEWYNVDVTWEDPFTNVKLGFDRLLNHYINRTDVEFAINHVRDNGFPCTATKYGPNTVTYYLDIGMIDTNANLDLLRRNYISQILNLHSIGNDDEIRNVIDKLLVVGVKYDDNSNFVNATDLEVNGYILSRIAAGETVITFVTFPGTNGNLAIDKSNWLQDNIKLPGKCTLQKFVSSDGTWDSRILIFTFGY